MRDAARYGRVRCWSRRTSRAQKRCDEARLTTELQRKPWTVLRADHKPTKSESRYRNRPRFTDVRTRRSEYGDLVAMEMFRWTTRTNWIRARRRRRPTACR